MLGESLSVS
jgi:HlyD family secretion protein